MNPLSLFNSTSLLFLGVLVLVCALLFVYFENKAREQNHKISSMLSLVSSLTEEVHSIRRQMNPIGGGCVIKQNAVHYEVDDDLVSVSDDDEEELDEDEDDELDEDEELDEVEDEDEDEVEDEDEDEDEDDEDVDIMEEIGDNVKILTLLQPIELVSDEEDDSDALDVEELDSSDDEGEEEKLTNDDVKIFDLKSIHLEESATVDYKKLSVGKLKTIVAEKGLAQDPAKLKKQELLKLLNAE
jgi:hypothetical protein